MSGQASPIPRSTTGGILPTRIRPTPAARAKSSTTWRWLRGSFDGTCQARPQALGSVPAITSIRATSSVNDQVCGRSARPSTETPLPRRTRPTIRSPSALAAPGPMKSEPRTSAIRTRPAWCAASASCQTRARTRPLRPVAASGVASVIGCASS